ncbi:Fic family protein [Rudaea sp.]
MTREQIQSALGLKSEDHFRKACLRPALASGLLERRCRTNPAAASSVFD